MLEVRAGQDVSVRFLNAAINRTHKEIICYCCRKLISLDNSTSGRYGKVRDRQPIQASSPLQGYYRIAGELVALAYIAIIAWTANATGAFYILFPELGALSQDVMTRPRGRWANSPLLLAISPALTGVIGIFFTRLLPYGYISVLLTVAGAVAVVIGLRSPVAPAISAGLLPLVLGVTSWWYPPAILFGTTLLAIISIPWRTFCRAYTPAEPALDDDAIDDILEETPGGYGWIGALMAFVAVAVFFVKLTAMRFVLFPPLVVIGFEMLGHTDACPWAKTPFRLPLACFLTALGGFVAWRLLGVTPIAAGCAMGWGIAVLRVFDLHMPPALAVALLPLVMDHPTAAYPFAVGIGTALLSAWFLAYRRIARETVSTPWASRAAARR